MNLKKYRKVNLYKIGRYQEDFEYIFPNIKIKNYITDKNIKIYKGKKCLYLKDLGKYIKHLKHIIVICDRKNNQIKNKFKKLGLEENKNYIFLEDFAKVLDDNFSTKEQQIIDTYKEKYCIDLVGKSTSNSELFKQMMYTDPTHNLHCENPFVYAQVQPNGFLFSCCAGWVNENIGNIFLRNPKKVWNSNKANLLRLSIINKTYAFCNLNNCPLKDTDVNRGQERVEKLKKTNIPACLSLGFDMTCNLNCKCCRNELINRNNNQIFNDMNNEIIKKLHKDNWLIKPNTLIVANQGEVFFSETYKKLIYSKKMKGRDSILIHTNGTLLNEANLNKLYSKYKDISLFISVDSINEETYKKLRCGGNAKALRKNLDVISKARIDGKLSFVSILCVLQKENYKELPDLAKFVIDHKFDRLDVGRIANWGTFTDEEFKEISMYDEFDKPKKELIEILKNPIFESKDIEFSGNVFKND